MDIEKSIRENQLGAKLHVGKVLGGVDTIEKSITEDIIKGKPAVAGEIREWSGKKYKKQPNGKWVEVSEYGMTKKEHIDESFKRSKEADKAQSVNERRRISERVTPEIIRHNKSAKDLSDKEYDEEELGGKDRKGFIDTYEQIRKHPKFDWILYKLHATKEWKSDGGGRGLNNREKIDKEFNTLKNIIGNDDSDWKNKLSEKLGLDLNSDKSEYERRAERNSK